MHEKELGFKGMVLIESLLVILLRMEDASQPYHLPCFVGRLTDHQGGSRLDTRPDYTGHNSDRPRANSVQKQNENNYRVSPLDIRHHSCPRRQIDN